jgi:hypothetical protein
MADTEDARATFIDAAFWHGPLDRAASILAAHPEIASSDIHTAAILGDDAAVRRFLADDPANATGKTHGARRPSYADPLTIDVAGIAVRTLRPDPRLVRCRLAA